MKRKKTDEMIQSAIRLPLGLHERLKRAGGERGMGEEIRRRLEASFEAEKAPVAPKTRQLLDAICHFVDETGRDFGSWSDDPFAFEVLKGAVNMLMAHDKPKGKPDPNPKPDGVGELLYGQVLPQKMSVGFWPARGSKTEPIVCVQIRSKTSMKGLFANALLGHWAIVIDQRDPATGQRKRRWHSFTGTKRTAQIECARLISELQRGTYLEPNKITVAQFLERWLEDVRRGSPQNARAIRRDREEEPQSAARRHGSNETAADADIRCLHQGSFRRPQRRQGRIVPEHGALHARRPQGCYGPGCTLADAAHNPVDAVDAPKMSGAP